MEEALAIELEGDDGKLRPFAEMTDERQRAYAKLRLQSGAVRPGSMPRASTPGTQPRDLLLEVLKPYLEAGQVQTRRIGSEDVVDGGGEVTGRVVAVRPRPVSRWLRPAPSA